MSGPEHGIAAPQLPIRGVRRHDVDALRVILFGLLIWLHYVSLCTWTQEAVPLHTNKPALLVMSIMHQWRLAALFAISGMGTAFAFGRRSWQTYLKERIVRLLIPLLFATYVLLGGLINPVDTTSRLFEIFPGISRAIWAFVVHLQPARVLGSADPFIRLCSAQPNWTSGEWISKVDEHALCDRLSDRSTTVLYYQRHPMETLGARRGWHVVGISEVFSLLCSWLPADLGSERVLCGSGTYPIRIDSNDRRHDDHFCHVRVDFCRTEFSHRRLGKAGACGLFTFGRDRCFCVGTSRLDVVPADLCLGSSALQSSQSMDRLSESGSLLQLHRSHLDGPLGSRNRLPVQVRLFIRPDHWTDGPNCLLFDIFRDRQAESARSGFIGIKMRKPSSTDKPVAVWPRRLRYVASTALLCCTVFGLVVFGWQIGKRHFVAPDTNKQGLVQEIEAAATCVSTRQTAAEGTI